MCVEHERVLLSQSPTPPPLPRLVQIPAQYIHLPPELAYITAWSANMSTALAPVLGGGSSPTRGGFAAACFTHTSFSSSKPLIGGKSFLDVAAAWYTRAAGSYKVSDDCGAPFCNDSCP